jgi:hypothetical protein
MWSWAACPSNCFVRCFQSAEKKPKDGVTPGCAVGSGFSMHVFYNTEKFHVQQSKKEKKLFR